MIKSKSVYSKDGKLLHRLVEYDKQAKTNPSLSLSDLGHLPNSEPETEREWYHKLGGHLNRIIGYADLLADGVIDLEQVREYARIIRENGKQLHEMISEQREQREQTGGGEKQIQAVIASLEKGKGLSGIKEMQGKSCLPNYDTDASKVALVIDDDKASHVILESWFRQFGYLTLHAESLSEAEKFLQSDSPSLIFSDYQFPEECTESFLRKQMELGRLSGKTLISISGTDRLHLNEDYKKFFHSFLNKPFSKQDFRLILESVQNNKEQKTGRNSAGKKLSEDEEKGEIRSEWKSLDAEEKELLGSMIQLGDIDGIRDIMAKIRSNKAHSPGFLAQIEKLVIGFEIDKLTKLYHSLCRESGI